MKAVVYSLAAWVLLALPAAAQQAVEPLPDMVMGSPDAKVELIEYASMSCPHCAAFHAEILPTLKTKYIDTGKVKYIFREFPLNATAYQGAILARCSGDRFFAFIDVLFREQSKWAASTDPMSELKQLGRLGGLPPEKFEACLQDKKITEGILQTRFTGEQQFKINSTPSFVINGKLYVGNQSLAEIENVLEAAVKGASLPTGSTGAASKAAGNSGVPPYLIVVVVVILVGGVGIYLLRRRSPPAGRAASGKSK